MAWSGRLEQSGSTDGSGNVGRTRKRSGFTSGASACRDSSHANTKCPAGFLSAYICYIPDCKRLSGFGQNIHTHAHTHSQAAPLLFPKQAEEKKRGVIGHGHHKKRVSTLKQWIVRSICPINLPMITCFNAPLQKCLLDPNLNINNTMLSNLL